MRMEFDPEAAEALERLYERDPRTAERVDEWLDRLEADPSERAVRRQRFTQPPVWCIEFGAPDGRRHAILWALGRSTDSNDEEVVVVRYIGLATFT